MTLRRRGSGQPIDLAARLEARLLAVAEATDPACEAAAAYVLGEVKQELSKPGGGRVYVRGKVRYRTRAAYTRASVRQLEEEGPWRARLVYSRYARQIRASGVSLRGRVRDGRIRVAARAVRTHRASAPGQPPARDMGALVGSTAYQRVRLARYAIGTPLKVGDWMEYGTRHRGGRVAPRPWLGPVFARTHRPVRALIQEALAKALREHPL